MFTLFTLFAMIGTATLPLWFPTFIHLFSDSELHQSYSWLPVVAGVLFFGAFFIPDIHISNETSTFQQHFVGGGVYTVLLYVYFKRLLGWQLSPLMGILLLFAWTSAFGVANEIFEFALTKSGITPIRLSDTSWDLLANTTGAIVTYVALWIARIEQLHSKR